MGQSQAYLLLPCLELLSPNLLESTTEEEPHPLYRQSCEKMYFEHTEMEVIQKLTRTC